MNDLPKISAIILAYNEEEFIEQIIAELKKQVYGGEVEIILVDGGSTDKTVILAEAQMIKIARYSQKGKAVQMNHAANISTGELLFFVHADMKFPSNIFSSIAKVIREGFVGGGFANIFDSNNKKIKRLGSLLNFRFFDKREQSDKGKFYGDNGIFVLKKTFIKIGGFKEIPIMEDYDFSNRLSKAYKTIKINNPVITVSARRHKKAGFIKTRLQWVLIKKLYKLGLSPHFLTKLYRDVR